MHKNKGERPITGIVRKKLMAYLEQKLRVSVYRFAKDSKIQSTICEHIKKEDYEVREKNIHKICSGMGISVSEIMEPEEEKRIF